MRMHPRQSFVMAGYVAPGAAQPFERVEAWHRVTRSRGGRAWGLGGVGVVREWVRPTASGATPVRMLSLHSVSRGREKAKRGGDPQPAQKVPAVPFLNG